MNTVLSIAVPLLFLALFILSIGYTAFRFRTLLGLRRRWPLRIGIGVGVFGSMTAMLSVAGSESTVVGLVGTLGGYLFTVYVFVLLLLLILHAASLKWRLPGKWIVWSTLCAAIATTGVGAFLANPFSVNEIKIPIEGLEDDVRIMHISDVHIGHQRGRAFLERIVEETNRHKPDLVLITGDLVDANAALLPGVLAPLADFIAPAYFVEGNHDNYVDKDRAMKQIASHDVRILQNEIVDTHGLYLVGLDYMNPDENTFDLHASEEKQTIKSVLPTLPLKDDKPSVLMHHSPVGAQYIAAEGVDLMVSGHTHAGQMFPATLFTPFIFPFNEGLHSEGDMHVFVSQGAGTFGPRVRLGTSNEINLIRLKASPSF